jgi:DNA replication protein DnaC
MSDEPVMGNVVPAQGIDLAAMRERHRQLIAEADAAYVAREKAERDELVGHFQAMAEKQLAAYRELPCGGELARIGDCLDAFATACPQRDSPSCPRRIRAFDEAEERKLLAERMSASGIPRGVLDVVVGGMESTEATQAVDEWLPGGKRLLLLSGGVGTGKSVAAGYAIRRSRGRWLYAPNITKVASFGDKQAEALATLRATKLLVVDDIGAEFSQTPGWGRTELANLIVDRYEDGLRTLMTTNLDAKAWRGYADERLRDRLGGKLGLALVIGGKSRRR